MVWWLTCFIQAPRPPSFNIHVAFYALAGASLYSYSASELRCFWHQIWKLGQSGCPGCMGLETLPPLNSYIQRACAVRMQCWESQRCRIHGGVVAHIPLIWLDPHVAVHAWCMSGDPNSKNPSWSGNTVACRS